MAHNICIFLNGERGFAVTKALFLAGHEVSKVITTKRNFAAVEKHLQRMFPWKSFSKPAIEAVTDFHDPNFLNTFERSSFDISVIAGFSTIFEEKLLNLPRLGTINLHAGRLPSYRGGSPLNWQLINNEKYIGLSVIKASAKIDGGTVLSETQFLVEEHETIKDLHDKANSFFPGLTLDAIDKLVRMEPGRIQDENEAVYWHQRSDLDGHLDPTLLTANQAGLLIRALTKPYPGAFCYTTDGVKVRIFALSRKCVRVSGTPGRVCFLQGDGPFLICKDFGVLISDYKIEGTEGLKLRHGDILN